TLHTFSATFESVPACDESAYVRDILRGRKLKAQFIPADQSGPLSHWQKIFQSLDEPALGNGYLTWLMNQTAHKTGVKVLLNGYDGDTTIGHGTLYPYELAQAGHWQQALDEAELFAQRLSVAEIPPLKFMRRMSYEVLAKVQKKTAVEAIHASDYLNFRRLSAISLGT
ncbi:MAG: hypothetical protein HC810_06355, partial [Acaryochloridaceae cyanobacterium RL_2_7]|nr:hypothetical protein [Acaryochloridaceae cyanobacterium RL_2_7]